MSAFGVLKTFKEMVVFMEELANNQLCKVGPSTWSFEKDPRYLITSFV
jgi:hypothetical protein